MPKTERYEKVATEFITQVFSTEDYDCSYIVKPNSEQNLLETIEEEMPALNYRNQLMEILKIEKKETLDSLLKLSNDFEFHNSMFKNRAELIDIEKFKVLSAEFDSIVKNGTQKEIDDLFAECPSEFYFISKPVFDKEFKTAVIDIQIGFTCIISQPWIFTRKENGMWK